MNGLQPKRSLFTRVLAVMIVAGAVPLGISVVTSMIVIGDDKEADVIEGAITRADFISNQIDHATRHARTQLQAAVLAADTGRYLDIRSMASETVVAIRCLRDETELLEAAAEPHAHETLVASGTHPPGTVTVLDEQHLVVSERFSDVDASALLNLEHELRVPRGWEIALSVATEGAQLGTVATRQGEDSVRVTSHSHDGVSIVLTAPLAPAREAAYATGRRAALFSLLAVVPLMLLAWLLSRAVTRPVRRLASAVRAAGSEEIQLPALPDDEIGALGQAIRRLTEELRGDSERLRMAVEFSRRAGRKLEPERVLASLGRSITRAFPDGGYRVVTVEQLSREEIPEDLSSYASVFGRSLGARELGEESPGSVELSRPVNLGDDTDLCAIAVGDTSRWHAIVVGAPTTERQQRGVELLCETAGAALRNNELVRRALVNEKLTVLGRLAAGVAHEINNPLAYVIVNLHSLTEDLEGEALETAQDALAGAERAARIVEDLSALHRGGARVQLGKSNLRTIAEEAAKIARARRRHVDIEVTGGESVRVVCERQRIEQSLINLIINACDAARHASAPRVTLKVGGTGQRAFVEVSDNGTGVPEDVRAHLFDPFFTTKGEEGTGLGLFLALSFVEANRGTLELASTGEDGTTFRLRLPMSPTSVAPDEPDERKERPDRQTGKRARILIVDDEPAIVRGMERWLGRRAAVTGVTDPVEGLALAREGGFALVLCDMNMPNMSGREFVQSLRESAPKVAERVVIVTGSGGDMPDGVPVLRKPLDSEALTRLLAHIGAPEPRQLGAGE